MYKSRRLFCVNQLEKQTVTANFCPSGENDKVRLHVSINPPGSVCSINVPAVSVLPIKLSSEPV
jgi:hypothetical protein